MEIEEEKKTRTSRTAAVAPINVNE